MEQRGRSLGASLAHDSAVLCQVWELLRAESPAIGAALCAAAGAKNVGMAVVRSEAGAERCRAQLSNSRSLLRTFLPSVQHRFFRRGLQPGHPQGLLALPAVQAPGFLGHLVNLVHLTRDQLAARIELLPPAPQQQAGGGRRGQQPPAAVWLTLRETVLHFVFGSTMLFDTDDHLRAFERQSPELVQACTGLRSLQGGSVARSGVEDGADAQPAPRFFAAPGVPWAERQEATLDPTLRRALAAAAAVDVTQAASAAAAAAAKAAAVTEREAGEAAASARAELVQRQQEAAAASRRYEALRAAADAAAAAVA
jgi:hypothetical protein